MVATKEKTATEQSALRVGKVAAQDFMRFDVFESDFAGRHAIARGPNAAGKTTILDMVWLTLQKAGKKVKEPVRNGANKAVTSVEIIDAVTGATKFIAERTWTNDETRLTVRAPDGSKINKGSELVERFLDEWSLNLGLFLRSRPQDQVDEVLRVCEIMPPVAAIEAIMGEPCPAKPGESAYALLERYSADETGVVYVRRRETHRALDQKQAAAIELRNRLQLLGGPLENGQGPVSSSDILEKIGDLQEAADRRREAEQQARDRRKSYDVGMATIAGLETDLAKNRAETAEVEEQIRRLQARQQGLKQQGDALAERIEQGKVKAEAFLKVVEAAEAKVAEMEDPMPAIADLRRSLEKVESTNAALVKRKQGMEAIERVEAEAVVIREEHARLDICLQRLRELRKSLLEGSDLGIAGLEIGDGELRLNGVTFSQASTAEQVAVACALAFKHSPDLKILRYDNAESLDDESLRKICEMADAAGWQLLLSQVERSGGLRVEFVERTVAA